VISRLTLGRLKRGTTKTLKMLTLGRLGTDGTVQPPAGGAADYEYVTVQKLSRRDKQIREEDDLIMMMALAFLEIVD